MLIKEINPAESPDIKYLLFGLKDIHKTQFLWLSITFKGVSVSISQNLIVVSPDPLAQY